MSCPGKRLLNNWHHSWCTYDVFVGVRMISLPVFSQTFVYPTLAQTNLFTVKTNGRHSIDVLIELEPVEHSRLSGRVEAYHHNVVILLQAHWKQMLFMLMATKILYSYKDCFVNIHSNDSLSLALPNGGGFLTGCLFTVLKALFRFSGKKKGNLQWSSEKNWANLMEGRLRWQLFRGRLGHPHCWPTASSYERSQTHWPRLCHCRLHLIQHSGLLSPLLCLWAFWIVGCGLMGRVRPCVTKCIWEADCCLN